MNASIQYSIEGSCASTRLAETAAFIEGVFMDALSPRFSEQGRQTFLQYVSLGALSKRLESESFLLSAVAHGKVVGALEMKTDAHLSLLFVHPEWQRKGIARELLNRAKEKLAARGNRDISVNATLGAVPAYLALGFCVLSEAQEKDGIQFVPMRLNRDKV